MSMCVFVNVGVCVCVWLRIESVRVSNSKCQSVRM